MIKTLSNTKTPISTSEPNYIKFRFSRDRVIGDSENSVLVNITKDFNVKNPIAVGVPKSRTFQTYGNGLNASYPETFTFELKHSEKPGLISVEELKRLIAID